MVKAIVNIEDSANRIINIVKARENLKDKSDAINMIIGIYAKEMLEPELRPEFIKELVSAQKEKTINVKDFELRYS